WVVRGADSFALGEPVKLLAFDGDHTRFEDPPLASGRRERADNEAEIGVGLAQALGIGPGATLAVQLPIGGATTRNGDFLGILAALLRVVALIDALVCLYALAQSLALTARERRPTLALLRATGAPASTVGAVLAGAGLAIAVPSALLALALEHWVLAPLVGDLAAGYADL